MKNASLLLTALLAGASLGLTGGCVVEQPPAYVNPGVEVAGDPPPLIVETIPNSPGYGFIWIGGSWVWHDHWVWEGGRWARPPHPGAVWVPHRYESRNGRHVFIRGGWH